MEVEYSMPEDGTHYEAYYKDTGCSIAPSCLKCPLPRCRYDLPIIPSATVHRLARDAKVLAGMEQYDLTVEEAAERYGLAQRTIFRIKERERHAS